MDDETKRTLIIGISVFATLSSLAWAIAIANIYSPPAKPMTAMARCAAYSEARSSSFCLELVRRAAYD